MPRKIVSPLSRRALIAAVVGVATAGVLGINYSDRYLPVMADWYLDMAVPYAADGVGSNPLVSADENAFYACARRVVKRLDEAGAIATFPAPSQARSEATVAGGYRIESFVREAVESGETRLRRFSCTVKYDRGRWSVEDVWLQPVMIAGMAR